MAVSKRLRFEILRRDNHTCRYCGASAPDVALRVDHVTPEALGGRTEPSNLVTACEPCNSGKSSVALDGAMVEDIKADALRLAELQRQAYAVLVQNLQERTAYEDAWVESWSLPLIPEDWRRTVGRWHEMGVPLELVADAARIACQRSRGSLDATFRYFCGIVWNQVSTITAEAAVKLTLDGAWKTAEQLQKHYEDGMHDGQFLAADGGSWLDDTFKEKHEKALADRYDQGWWAGAKVYARHEPYSLIVEGFIDRFTIEPRPWLAELGVTSGL